MKERERDSELDPNIYFFSIGGAGGNMLENTLRLIAEKDIPGVNLKFIFMNTDHQAINAHKERLSDINNGEIKYNIEFIQLGNNLLGAGADPQKGREAAEFSREEIRKTVGKAHAAFLFTGFGGGTGSGASPVVAEILRDLGLLVMVFGTTPFDYEGAQRKKIAHEALQACLKSAHMVVPISNQALFERIPNNLDLKKVFRELDQKIAWILHSMLNMLYTSGLINVDFADLKAIITPQKITGDEIGQIGSLGFAIGVAPTDKPDNLSLAKTVIEQAIFNPLIDLHSALGLSKSVPLKANSALIYIEGNVTLREVKEIMDLLLAQLGENARIIHGVNIINEQEDKKLQDGLELNIKNMQADKSKTERIIRVTIIMTEYTEREEIKGPKPTVTDKPKDDLFSLLSAKFQRH